MKPQCSLLHGRVRPKLRSFLHATGCAKSLHFPPLNCLQCPVANQFLHIFIFLRWYLVQSLFSSWQYFLPQISGCWFQQLLPLGHPVPKKREQRGAFARAAVMFCLAATSFSSSSSAGSSICSCLARVSCLAMAVCSRTCPLRSGRFPRLLQVLEDSSPHVRRLAARSGLVAFRAP
jgi:hypothetical protein